MGFFMAKNSFVAEVSFKFLSILTWYSKFFKKGRMEHQKGWNKTALKYPWILPGLYFHLIVYWTFLFTFTIFHWKFFFCFSYKLCVCFVFAVIQKYSIKTCYSNDLKWDKREFSVWILLSIDKCYKALLLDLFKRFLMFIQQNLLYKNSF